MTGPRAEIGLDLAESGPLRRWLEELAPAVEIRTIPDMTESGGLGAGDTLGVLAGSGGALVVAIRLLPEFLRARRAGVKLTVTVTDRSFELEADSAEEFLPIIEQLIAKIWDD
jgi:hypothetical protein